MKFVKGFFYSLPVQLLLVHFRKYQVLLVLWYLLFAMVGGALLQRYGLEELYLSPEYLGEVNVLSSAFVGTAFAVFIMCWNITTFILYSKHLHFLATTSQPFLKYCINNALLPLIFLTYYAYEAFVHGYWQELLSAGQICLLIAGFLVGFVFAISIAFLYFFSADKTIYRFLSATVKDELEKHKSKYAEGDSNKKYFIRVHWFLSATLKLRRPRDVSHYSDEFIDKLFKQHHIAAMLSMLLAFGSLIASGYFLDNKYFQLPAAASITVLFALIIAVSGAFSYFLKGWSIVFLFLVIMGLNWMYEHNFIDPRNKVYGLNYATEIQRPGYDKETISALASSENISKDSLAFIATLNKWKQKQGVAKPTMFLICTSGGGNRAAFFTMNILQRLDSLSHGGVMAATTTITGASGGMLGAAYFRELYLQKQLGTIAQLSSQQYAEDISKDLLNPIATNFVARDLLGPAQNFTWKNKEYIKDRGYAFEQKLMENTHGLLNKTLQDYALPEAEAKIPSMFFNAVITRDGRRLSTSTRPARFMMRSLWDTATIGPANPDAVDFFSYFKSQTPQDVRLATVLRMGATFPYVLPSAWLPTEPVIDVMDAGFRDNTGIDISLRYLYFFRKWIKENCGQVVMLQIRGRKEGSFETNDNPKSVFELFSTPALLTQNNLFSFQEYAQFQELQYFEQAWGSQFLRLTFLYEPINKEASASISFHLTQREKLSIIESLNSQLNTEAFKKFVAIGKY